MKPTIALTALAFLATGMSVKAQTGRSFGDGTLPEFLKPFADTGATTLTAEQREAARKGLAGNPQLDLAKLALDKWDLNGDGKLEPIEIENARKAIRGDIDAIRKDRFAKADTDSNGYLSLVEFTAAAPPDKTPAQIALDFALLDTNKDKQISFDEFVAGCPKPPVVPDVPMWAMVPFDAVDTEKDGIISFEEFTALLTNPPQPPMGGKPPAVPAEVIAAIFAKLDVNADNGITPDEWPVKPIGTPPAPPTPQPLADFATADKNADGSVDPMEFGMVARASHIDCLLANKLFHDADVNADHLLDATEYATITLPTPPTPPTTH